MNIIICEGKTDAILLSYFLIKVYNFHHNKSQIVGLPVRKGQAIDWYINANRTEVAIWSAGGYNNLSYNLKDVVERNVNEPNPEKRFEKIIIYCDRDNKNEEDLIGDFKTWFKDSNIHAHQEIAPGDWLSCTIELRKSSKEAMHIRVLPVILPLFREGALETFLLDAFSEEGSDQNYVVENARDYVKKIPDTPYLPKNRLREKASLGSVLSVFSPDWVFSEINERLVLIPWEKIPNTYSVYSKLGDLA